MKLSPKGKIYAEVFLLIFSVIFTYLFWDSFFIYPIKLFVVLLHESSHCLIALITGGSVKEIEISYEVGGECLIQGGNSFAIAISGYLGSIIWGGLLFISSNYFKFSKYLCSFLSLIFIILIFSLIKELFGILFTLGFAVVLFLFPRILPQTLYSYILKIIGTISLFYAIIDIKDDLITTEIRKTDAQVLAGLTNVPSYIWGIAILGISFFLVYVLLRINFQKGKK